MTLQECYQALDGNYDDVLGRLRSERLVQKFVLKFLDDKSYELLCSSMEAENWQEAFRASHTIKGMCQNLSFTRLQQSSSNLTESLRNGWTPEAVPLLDQVKQDYQQAAAAIGELKASLGL